LLIGEWAGKKKDRKGYRFRFLRVGINISAVSSLCEKSSSELALDLLKKKNRFFVMQQRNLKLFILFNVQLYLKKQGTSPK